MLSPWFSNYDHMMSDFYYEKESYETKHELVELD